MNPYVSGDQRAYNTFVILQAIVFLFMIVLSYYFASPKHVATLIRVGKSVCLKK